MTGVNEKGATFNRNAQLDSQTVGKGGTFFNGQSQIGSQIDIGLGGGGLGFINKGSQTQTQIGCGDLVHNPTELQKCILQGRKKREAQFVNIGSQVGTQIGHAGSLFNNLNSQISTQIGELGSTFNNQDSQIAFQHGLGNLGFAGLGNIGQAAGSGNSNSIFNFASQIGQQFGGRK